VAARAPFYLICGIALVGCFGLVVSVVALVVEGGYHPEVYRGGLDPVRAGLLVVSLAGMVIFALFLFGSIVRIRRRRNLGSMADGLAAGGLLICAAGFAAVVMVFPASGGPIPPMVATALRIGAGLFVVGVVLLLIDNLRRWIRA
jgi:hypothetical protein